MERMDSLDRPVPAPRSLYRQPGSCRDELSDNSSSDGEDDVRGPPTSTTGADMRARDRLHGPSASRQRWQPSNSRGTNWERCDAIYSHLVARGHFRSRDKDGGHTVRSATTENIMALAMFYVEAVLWPIEVLHCGNTHFRPFYSSHLDLEGP